MTPTVSILMPSRNQAAFLPEAIRSVMEQSHRNLELIVADGASEDETISILKNLEGTEPRLRWFSEPDSGPAQAVNKAASKARGRILGWLNADDLLEHQAVEEAVHYFDSHPETTLLYGHAELMDESGSPLGLYPTKTPPVRLEDFQDGCFLSQPTVFFPALLFHEIGGLDESLRNSFDFDLWMRILQKDPHHIGFVDRIQARPRIHPATITARHRDEVALEGMLLMKRFFGGAKENWLLSHFQERFQEAREVCHPVDLHAEFLALIEKSRSLLRPDGLDALSQFLASHPSIPAAKIGLFPELTIDHWTKPQFRIDFRQTSPPVHSIQIHANPHSDSDQPITIRILHPCLPPSESSFPGNEPFQISIPVPDIPPGCRTVFFLLCPITQLPFSQRKHDQRKLGLSIDRIFTIC